VIVAFSIFLGVWGAFFPPYGQRAFPCLAECPGLPPFADLAHPLGSYPSGMDVLNQLLLGAPVDLMVGIGGAAIALALGLVVGTLAGQRRGVFGTVFLGVTQVFLLMPILVMVVWIWRFYGGTIFESLGATLTFVVVIGLFTWPPMAFVARGEAMRIRELEFVQGAKAIGASQNRIAFRHVLPNLLSSVAPLGSLLVASNILMEFFVTYLGLGMSEDVRVYSWGLVMRDGIPYLTSHWWISFFPGLLVTIVAIGFILLGDALVTVLNPRLRLGYQVKSI
jgi:peptide/nickel transport system permease protein